MSIVHNYSEPATSKLKHIRWSAIRSLLSDTVWHIYLRVAGYVVAGVMLQVLIHTKNTDIPEKQRQLYRKVRGAATTQITQPFSQHNTHPRTVKGLKIVYLHLILECVCARVSVRSYIYVWVQMYSLQQIVKKPIEMPVVDSIVSP